jgi:late competence protein required for DNA uptake (superfamily II DNA/RNA helicase)
VGKTERKRPLGGPRSIWEGDIKKNLQKLSYAIMDWIELAQIMMGAEHL